MKNLIYRLSDLELFQWIAIIVNTILFIATIYAMSLFMPIIAAASGIGLIVGGLCCVVWLACYVVLYWCAFNFV